MFFLFESTRIPIKKVRVNRLMNEPYHINFIFIIFTNILIFNVKNLFLFLVFFVSAIQLNAQTISPVIQNIGGSIGQQSEYRLDFSIGELSSIQYFVSPNNSTLSTGFFQSFTSLVTGINNIAIIESNQVNITPNPVLNIFKIKTFFQKPGDIQFQIIDVLSNQKYISQSLRIQGNYEQLINIEKYPSGVYYIKVFFKPTNGVSQGGVFKIIKL